MNNSRYVKLLSLVLSLAIVVGLFPTKPLRADTVEASNGALSLVYNEVAKWDDLTQSQVDIRNNGEVPVSGWEVELTYQGTADLSSVWNAKTEESAVTENNILRFANEDYNAVINPHESVSFGFISRSSDPGLPRVMVEEKDPSSYVESGLFPYAMFAENNLNFSGWKSNVVGDIYGGTRFNYLGSELTVYGSVRSAGEAELNGCSIGVGRVDYGVAPVGMPDFSLPVRNKQNILGPIDVNALVSADSIIADGYLYSDGDITISGSKFTGDCVIVASGNITYNVDSISGDGRLLLYSENGNITINGSQITVNGILYAPNGNVAINAYDTTINGRVIGKNIEYSGSVLNVNSNSADLDPLYDFPAVSIVASRNEIVSVQVAEFDWQMCVNLYSKK